MANLTITIDDDVLLRARIRTLEQGTSVNALLRDYLKHYAGLEGERVRATERLLELSDVSQAGHEGKRWTRDELHER